MSDWRDSILVEFAPQVANLTLVSDPDGLLTEEKINQEIKDRGFDLITYEDPIKFRYYYESKYRMLWDRNQTTQYSVVLRTPERDINLLPYDLISESRQLSFSLADLFPSLSYPIVSLLEINLLDELYNAQVSSKPGDLGDNDSKDYILRHVFEIAPEIIKHPPDLLRFLIRHHAKQRRIPETLNDRLISLFRRNKLFHDWPLESILVNKENFYLFLQERWPIFLNQLDESATQNIGNDLAGSDLKIKGILGLPFDHDEIKPLVDNLFLEGILKPVQHPNSGLLGKRWASFGLKLDPNADKLDRAEGLLGKLTESIPSHMDRHDKWLAFAIKLASLNALVAEISQVSTDLLQRTEDLRSQVNDIFYTWLTQSYASLSNLPAVPPIMLHHIARAMAFDSEHKYKKALIVFDGMALEQWIALREIITEQDTNLSFEEKAVFAWIPTITSVSRQTIFAGNPPYYFPKSISTTSKEASHWKQFWTDQGLRPSEISYKFLHGDTYDKPVREIISDPNIQIIGLVVDMIDKIVHGMELGYPALQEQVKQWGFGGFCTELLQGLLNEGYQIWITSDHGNTASTGFGDPREGSLADSKGRRARIFSDQILRDEVRSQFPEAIEWPSIGLPDEFYPLIAPNKRAFAQEGKQVITHGGATIEEVIVPFVKIERIN